jgi:hypothetical protein
MTMILRRVRDSNPKRHRRCPHRCGHEIAKPGVTRSARLCPSVYGFGGEIQPDSPQLKAVSAAIWKAGAG